MALPNPIRPAIARQRGQLFVLTPVLFGLGIAWFFALKVEPGAGAYLMAGGGVAVALALAGRAGETLAPLLIAVALILSGLLTAGARTHWQAAPVLDFRYYGPIAGRIVAVDRSSSNKLRLTLDRVVLSRVSADDTPERVRISLHGDQSFVDPIPGARVATTGHLMPPSGAVEPGGFDFRRHAWFDRLGAIGYTRVPVLAMEAPQAGEPLMALGRIRLTLSQAVRDRLPGQVGAFAAVVTTGDRSALSDETAEAMRHTNLAHLLAISGLHMGLLTGVVFAAVRIGLALCPPIALRYPTKKWAAIVALIAATGYLALSGGAVSTRRAYVMAVVVLCAVLLDRRAFTLRSVAIAALIVMVLQPEALLGPGFQMSFAATTALVWTFAMLRGLDRKFLPKWSRGLASLVISSAVAGAATFPIAAVHFNQSAAYGLAANLASVPMMGALVMPSAVLAAVLAPIGAEMVGLWPMGLGIRWILWVAHSVAGLEGAVHYYVRPDAAVLPMIVLGMLWLMLWRGRSRVAGIAVVLVAVAMWARTERPDVLIAANGAIAGIMTDEGRAMTRATGHGFITDRWQKNDAIRLPRDAATYLAKPFRAGDLYEVPIGGGLAVVFSADTPEVQSACAAYRIVVTNRPAEFTPTACLLLDPDRLAQTGAVSLSENPAGHLTLRSVASVAGKRLWTTRSLRDHGRMPKATPSLATLHSRVAEGQTQAGPVDQ